MKRTIGLMFLVFALAIAPAAMASRMTGAVYTTLSDCVTTNGNVQYPDKQSVYLNGGPGKGDSAGLPAGDYYVQITSPGGVLLGTSIGGAHGDTPVHVSDPDGDGQGSFDTCYQLWEILIKASDGTKGYDDTPNPGGEYKVWVSRVSDFKNDESKTDNFKVQLEPPPHPKHYAHITLTLDCPPDLSIQCVNGQITGATPGKAFFIGQTITFNMTVTNDGELPLDPVSLSGSILDFEASGGPDEGLCGLSHDGNTFSNPVVWLNWGADADDPNATPAYKHVDLVDDDNNLVTSLAPGASAHATLSVVADHQGHYYNLATANGTVPSSIPDADIDGPRDVSDVASCWPEAYELPVSKTADTSYTRTFTWTLDKSVSAAPIGDGGTLRKGQSTTATYVITPTATPHDSDFTVSGSITVSNPSGGPVTVTLSDSLAGAVITCPESVAVDGAGYVVPAGSSITCSYSASVSDTSSGTNTATATVVSDDPVSFSGSKDYAFGDPSTIVNDDASISDVLQCTPTTVVCTPGSAYTPPWSEHAPSTSGITYTVVIQNRTACETVIHVDNVATLTDELQNTLSDDAHLSFNAGSCENTTLTQGAYGAGGNGKYWYGNTQYGAIDLMNLLLGTSGFSLGGSPNGGKINAGQGACVAQRLPASTGPTVMANESSGNLFGTSCKTSQPLDKQGRFKNILLGQTITLSFNTRLDPSLPFEHLCASFSTVPAIRLSNGTYIPDLSATPQNFSMSPNVVAAAHTVGGLLDLANLALSGSPIPSGMTISDINNAVDAINRGFDQTRFVVSSSGCF